MSKSREHARLLLAKADEDLYVLERLAGDPESPAAVIGFHAQQAVEKVLKAVLTGRGIQYTRTHDLAGLIDLLADHGIPPPPDPDRLPALTPFAAEFRYGQLPPEDAGSPTLDRQQALDIAPSEGVGRAHRHRVAHVVCEDESSWPMNRIRPVCLSLERLRGLALHLAQPADVRQRHRGPGGAATGPQSTFSPPRPALDRSSGSGPW